MFFWTFYVFWQAIGFYFLVEHAVLFSSHLPTTPFFIMLLEFSRTVDVSTIMLCIIIAYLYEYSNICAEYPMYCFCFQILWIQLIPCILCLLFLCIAHTIRAFCMASIFRLLQILLLPSIFLLFSGIRNTINSLRIVASVLDIINTVNGLHVALLQIHY